MKGSFLWLSMLVLAVTSRRPSGSSNPGIRACARTSPLANLICYADDQKNGFNYAFIGFNDEIVALTSIYLDCQPGVVCILNVLTVYGFMFRVSYPVKRGNTTEQGSKLWYINLSVPGCPSVEEIFYFEYKTESQQYDPALSPTPIEKNVAYEVYTEMITRDYEYEAQCNVFRAARVEEQCDNRAPYFLRTPTTRISMENVKSALVYNANPKLNGSGNEYIKDYGIRGLRCNASRIPVSGFEPPAYKEICDSTGYDRSPYCKNVEKCARLSEIAKSYGYDGSLENLDVYEACKLSTLWAQGYNCIRGNNNQCSSCSRNNPGGGTFTYVNIAIIPMASSFIDFGTPAYPEEFIFYIILKGYCPKSIKEDIMKYFVDAC